MIRKHKTEKIDYIRKLQFIKYPPNSNLSRIQQSFRFISKKYGKISTREYLKLPKRASLEVKSHFRASSKSLNLLWRSYRRLSQKIDQNDSPSTEGNHSCLKFHRHPWAIRFRQDNSTQLFVIKTCEWQSDDHRWSENQFLKNRISWAVFQSDWLRHAGRCIVRNTDPKGMFFVCCQAHFES